MTINRRDFLKLSTLLTTSAIMQPSLSLLPAQVSTDPNAKNVLIILFDTLTTSNINFYGYPRETMPNLTRLLDRATVYHNHYASSGFTTPGTASLLTGRHPWEHLALKLTNRVKPELAAHSIFSYFEKHYKLAYTHNLYADILLSQFSDAISQHKFYQSLFLDQRNKWFMDLMDKDRDIALLFKTRLEDTSLDGFLYSLLFPSLLGQDDYTPSIEIASRFPRGIPEADDGLFILEDAIDWIMQETINIPQPFLEYFHLLPPHAPYSTREEFVDTFLDDTYQPSEKPLHPVVIPANFNPQETELKYRRAYDEFLLYVDSEFNRLITGLDQQGILENTLLVLTSDHGEIFERRSMGHIDPYLFDPIGKIPLIIFEPGQTQRKDIHTPTSCVDLLPTLLHYTKQEIPSNLPGKILPPFSETSSEKSHTIFALDSRLNPGHSHLAIATLMMRRDNWKVIRYSGYADYYRTSSSQKLDAMQNTSEIYYEVFDLENDPEELNNLASDLSPEIQGLINELEQFYRENVEYPE